MLNAGWNPQFPPAMKALCHVVDVMDRWLLVAPENIVIVHCPVRLFSFNSRYKDISYITHYVNRYHQNKLGKKIDWDEIAANSMVE